MDNTQQPLFSIIVPTQGGAQITERILSVKSLISILRMEMIVVADREEQLTSLKYLFREEPWLMLTASNGQGVSLARNHGLEMAKGQYFILIDDDCDIADTEFLQSLRLKIDEKPQALHGGGYTLKSPSSYWAEVYNWINRAWLQRGITSEGYSMHLLGGFMFGSAGILSKIRFNPEMLWGGEEKEMLQRISEAGIYGVLHRDLHISHRDSSGLKKLIKRAFHQGHAAGKRNLQTRNSVRCAAPALLIPGLAIFYFCSRAAILLGKWDNNKSRKEVNVPNNSPIA